MRIERTKNATRNIVVGMILKIYQLLVPFVIRTVMIHVLGMEYLGLNSLFTSILQVLNLAELGVGSAMVFSMYKPIAEDDSATINDLMKLYQFYYRIIGMIILVIGIAITPFIPKLIKSDIPSGLNIYILYYLNLGATVISYWLFAYKNCLLTAHQRSDVISKVNSISNEIAVSVSSAFSNKYLTIKHELKPGLIFSSLVITKVIATAKPCSFNPSSPLIKEEVVILNRFPF